MSKKKKDIIKSDDVISDLEPFEFEVAAGANYLVSENPIVADPLPFAGMTPGMKLSAIGSKKRTQFSMQEGHWMQYCGINSQTQCKYAVFKSEGMFEPEKGKYYAYGFTIVGNPEGSK